MGARRQDRRDDPPPIGNGDQSSASSLVRLGQELAESLWIQGIVGQWYLKPKQRSVLEFLNLVDDPFFEGGRKFGKTTTTLVWNLEQQIVKSRITRWCEPFKNQCREIVMPEMDKIQSFIPSRYRFVWHQTDSYYECRWNGSRLYLRGVNEDNGESARGPSSDIIVCDEFGSWRRPKYVVDEVLRPQLLVSKGKMVFTGTCPKNLTQGWYEAKDKATLEGRFIQRTVKDQELVEWEQIEKIVKAMGGWECPAVRRELLCEKVVDPTSAIIPEWDDRFVVPFVSDEYFPFYFKYDALDIGVRHKTVNIFGYYDFRKAKLCVMDEVVLRGPEMTTERLAEETRAKEALHFGVNWEQFDEKGKKRWRAHPPQHFKIRRVSDIDLLLINDLSKLHGLFFEATDKGELEEMVNEVRLWCGAGRILVHPRCTELSACLKYGIWDEDRKKWETSELLGHFDALAALMYLVRNVNQAHNPIPIDYGLPHEEHWFSEDPKKKKTRDQFKKIFNLK